MTAMATLRVEVREKIGRGASRALRQSGLVPAVIYGAGKENSNFAVDVRDIMKNLQDPGFFTHLYELKLGNTTERALVKDVQFHPVTDMPLHVDFLRVSKDSKITVAVPITFINEDKSPGLKRGGVLNIVIHNLELNCPVDNIPDHLTIDLSGLEIGVSIHTDTLGLPKGVTVAHIERDNTIATILAPMVQKADEETASASA